MANLAALPPSGNTAGDARIILSTSILYSWNGTAWVAPSGAGSGTVTSVSITTANGISGTVATNSTTPAITLTLGAIVPTSVNSVVISGTATPTLAVTGTVTVSGSHSGTNTGDNATNSLYSSLVTNQTHTGDATGATVLTLATVNANIGTFGSATFIGVVTVNAKGLVTGASNVTIQIAEAQVTNLITDLAGKQGTITLTTTGSSGAATLIGNTLNIPNYAGGGSSTYAGLSDKITVDLPTINTPLLNALGAKVNYV